VTSARGVGADVATGASRDPAVGFSVVPSAVPISLADHRARRLVARLLEVQERIEDPDAPCDPPRAEKLFEDLGVLLEELARTSRHVKSARLRTAIERACVAHEKWWSVATTPRERAAVMAYLKSVDALARAAGAQR
jgi:hypothetical protein